jgi:hypothetical protein
MSASGYNFTATRACAFDEYVVLGSRMMLRFCVGHLHKMKNSVARHCVVAVSSKKFDVDLQLR